MKEDNGNFETRTAITYNKKNLKPYQKPTIFEFPCKIYTQGGANGPLESDSGGIFYS